jgi:hypothetical protein
VWRGNELIGADLTWRIDHQWITLMATGDDLIARIFIARDAENAVPR